MSAPTYTRLQRAAAVLSGRYCIDWRESQREGYLEVSATVACLEDVRDDLVLGAVVLHVDRHRFERRRTPVLELSAHTVEHLLEFFERISSHCIRQIRRVDT